MIVAQFKFLISKILVFFGKKLLALAYFLLDTADDLLDQDDSDFWGA